MGKLRTKRAVISEAITIPGSFVSITAVLAYDITIAIFLGFLDLTKA